MICHSSSVGRAGDRKRGCDGDCVCEGMADLRDDPEVTCQDQVVSMLQVPAYMRC